MKDISMLKDKDQEKIFKTSPQTKVKIYTL